MGLHILHTADLHLGKNRRFEDHLEQQGLMLDAIVRQVRQALEASTDDDVIFIVAGDVFDRNHDTRRAEFSLFLMRFMQPLLELRRRHDHFHFVMIDGNHDRQPNLEEPSVLTPLLPFFESIKNFHVALVEPEVATVAGGRFLLVPFNGYSTSELRDLVGDNDPDFVVAHECLSRMTTDVGYTPPRDQDRYIEINEVLPGSRVQGVFLGDIHRAQCLDDNGVCWYSGSPTTLDHGHKLPKGVLHHFYDVLHGNDIGDIAVVPNTYQRRSVPKLVPLDEPRLKTHHQLGIVDKVERIPWDRVLQGDSTYLSMVVSPEVYNEIDAKVPGFFAKEQVSYDFDRRAAKATEQAREEPKGEPGAQEDGVSYYEEVVRQWSDINLVQFTEELKEEFIELAVKRLETRSVAS